MNSAAADVPTATLADRIDDALPQTQCTRCGYPDCRGYASAIADGSADQATDEGTIGGRAVFDCLTPSLPGLS